MSNVGQRERMTQQRIVELFQTDLGYRYLGDWQIALIIKILKWISLLIG